MRAINLHQPYASLIAEGYKTIETRKWSTGYRGPLVIVASKKKVSKRNLELWRAEYPRLPEVLPYGQAICVIDLLGVSKFEHAHEEAACCDHYPGFAWHFEDVRRIEPFEVKGQLGLHDIPDERIWYVGSVNCRDCGRSWPHTHCAECGSIDHAASDCDMLG